MNNLYFFSTLFKAFKLGCRMQDTSSLATVCNVLLHYLGVWTAGTIMSRGAELTLMTLPEKLNQQVSSNIVIVVLYIIR